MTKARGSTTEQRTALKIAAQIVTNLCGGGKVAAGITAVDATTLSLYGAPHEEARHMRVDVALDLDLAAGEPIMARALASAQGWSLLRAGDATASATGLTFDDYSVIHREAFEAKSALFGVLQQPHLSDGAKRAVLKELADLRQAIAFVEAKIERG